MERKAVVDELRRVAQKMDSRSVSRSQFNAHATVSSAAVEQAFGSWNEAIVAAGLVPFPPGGIPKDEQRRRERMEAAPAASQSRGKIPDDELLDELVRLERELGRRPSGNQVAAKGKFNPSVYQRRWGTVAAAYDAAKRRDGR
jgi:hypothetical protein